MKDKLDATDNFQRSKKFRKYYSIENPKMAKDLKCEETPQGSFVVLTFLQTMAIFKSPIKGP